MKFSYSIALTLLLASLGIMGGCKKSKKDPFEEKFILMIKDNSLIYGAFDDVLKVSENILKENNRARISAAGAPLPCLTVDTTETGPDQHQYILTFNGDCADYDGKVRSGKIILDLTGANYNTAGSTLTIRFEHFSLGYSALGGKIKVINRGDGLFDVAITNENEDGYATYKIADSDQVLEWRSVHRKQITDGDNDPIMINNKYLIHPPYDNSAKAFEGVSRKGDRYSANISQPLTIDYSCPGYGYYRYPTAGTLDYHMEGESGVKYVDYGTGDCDVNVSIKADDTSQNHSLW
jgi:hypothetical protein